MKGDVAFEADRKTQVGAGGEADGATAGGGGGFDRAVDGGRVEGNAVAFGAVGADVEVGGGGAKKAREQERRETQGVGHGAENCGEGKRRNAHRGRTVRWGR